MLMYRIGETVNAEGWPFLFARNAYLADGTALTEYDRHGRIVPARSAFDIARKICSGGRLGLSDRRTGLEALARALDEGDDVRAPILLLQLQIDPDPTLGKFNQWHLPTGPGGGQFTTGPQTGVHPAELSMHVGVTSTYREGVYGEDIDIAHKLVISLVQSAALEVGNLGFIPGTKKYGTKLHALIAAKIQALGDPDLHAKQFYLDGRWADEGDFGPKNSSSPDVVYGPDPKNPLMVWEVKSGSATNLRAKRTILQRENTLKNVPGNPIYEYIQIYEKQ